MKTIALDILHDLRRRRLLPVALLLLVGLVAVPVVLHQPAEELTPPSQAAAPVAGPDGLPDPESALGGKPLVGLAVLQEPSNLEVFDPKDPFRPLKVLDDVGSKVAEVGSTPAAASGQPFASAGADTGGSAPSTFAGSSAPPASGGGGSSGGGGTVKETLYTYTVDLEFGKTGSERERKSVDRLTLLPDEDNPLLMFLGVTDDRRRTVFLVDSALSQSGEGRCEPSLETCSFLYLRTDEGTNEHFFTDEDGEEYTLRVLRINQEVVKSGSAGSASRRRARSGAERGPFDPFGFPLFVDAQG
jgi:hypothetical protein